MKKIACAVISLIVTISMLAQIDAGLFRYPDVSQSQIVFTYANDLWVMPKEGGTAVKLSSPAGVEIYPKFSPDGKQIAVTFRSQVGRNWKRYRGGWKADIYIFNFQTQASQNLSNPEDAGSEFPMWHGNNIYFLSDRGPELRMNLWCYDLTTKKYEQVTKFTDYDVHYPSIGPDDIVYEAGGKLYLYNISSQKQKEVKVNLVTDRALVKPKIESVETLVQNVNLSPDGNRVLIQARGDVFSVPAENGYVKDMTRTSGSAERYPAWSPDGKNIAYWSDQSGEYELWIAQPDKGNSAKKLTSYGAGFRYNLFWSPDSKKLAYIDKAMKIKICNVASGATTDVDKALRYAHGNLEGFTCSWSPDSRWLAYSRDLENQHNATFIYDYQNKKLQQLISGFYNCNNPVFSEDGKYLYVVLSASFQPYYSDVTIHLS